LLGAARARSPSLPYERAVATLADLLGAPVSPGTRAAWVAGGATDLGEFTAAVRGQLAGHAVVNFDETGLRVDGKSAAHCSPRAERRRSGRRTRPRGGPTVVRPAGQQWRGHDGADAGLGEQRGAGGVGLDERA
jgi:hypothetical protein